MLNEYLRLVFLLAICWTPINSMSALISVGEISIGGDTIASYSGDNLLVGAYSVSIASDGGVLPDVIDVNELLTDSTYPVSIMSHAMVNNAQSFGSASITRSWTGSSMQFQFEISTILESEPFNSINQTGIKYVFDDTLDTGFLSFALQFRNIELSGGEGQLEIGMSFDGAAGFTNSSDVIANGNLFLHSFTASEFCNGNVTVDFDSGISGFQSELNSSDFVSSGNCTHRLASYDLAIPAFELTPFTNGIGALNVFVNSSVPDSRPPPSPIPEPSSLLLLLTELSLIALFSFRKTRHSK